MAKLIEHESAFGRHFWNDGASHSYQTTARGAANMNVVSYPEHLVNLPVYGKHIVGQFDDESLVVYQEFNKQIARPALEQQRFVAPFQTDRLSWIKTNFMWMMFRSEWGQMSDYVLAIRIKRRAFEEILAQAEHAQFAPHWYKNTREWRKTLRASCVRVQWDPEHDPAGGRMKRRALQIGLRGEALEKYASEWIVSIEDVSPFVRSQRPFVYARQYDQLQVPVEAVYRPVSEAICEKLQLDECEGKER